MYCVNCGVELADSETVCPLCGTRVPREHCTVDGICNAIAVYKSIGMACSV